MPENIYRKEKIQIGMFHVAFVVILAIATTTPHIIHNDGIVSARYAQSLVILFDLVIGYFLFKFYNKKIDKMNQQKILYESRLAESYKYIGKAHGEVEILDVFSRYLQKFNKDPLNNEKIFNDILACMLVSVAKVDKGVMRFVDIQTGRTVAEFFFAKSRAAIDIKLSNRKIITGLVNDSTGDGHIAVDSDFDFGGLKCVLAFSQPAKLNIKLLKLLLNQAHSFFVTLKIRLDGLR